jgi:hypothetical protein
MRRRRTSVLPGLLACIVLNNTLALAGSLEGAWIARAKEDKVQMMLVMFEGDEWQGQWNANFSIKKDQLAGLTMDREHDFKLIRDAGTMAFHGKMTSVRGLGDFVFDPNETFRAFLLARGAEKLDDKEMLHLFLADLSRQYVAALDALGYADMPVNKLIAFAIHGVSIDYIKDIHALGYQDISPSKLLDFRIHGISAEYAEKMRRIGGQDVSPNELIALKIHGVTPGFAEKIQNNGYPDIPVSKLRDFKIHGMSAEFVQGVRELGYTDISPSRLIEFRIHGVKGECVAHAMEKLKAEGKEVTPSGIVNMKIQGK